MKDSQSVRSKQGKSELLVFFASCSQRTAPTDWNRCKHNGRWLQAKTSTTLGQQNWQHKHAETVEARLDDIQMTPKCIGTGRSEPGNDRPSRQWNWWHDALEQWKQWLNDHYEWKGCLFGLKRNGHFQNSQADGETNYAQLSLRQFLVANTDGKQD